MLIKFINKTHKTNYDLLIDEFHTKKWISPEMCAYAYILSFLKYYNKDIAFNKLINVTIINQEYINSLDLTKNEKILLKLAITLFSNNDMELSFIDIYKELDRENRFIAKTAIDIVYKYLWIEPNNVIEYDIQIDFF